MTTMRIAFATVAAIAMLAQTSAAQELTPQERERVEEMSRLLDAPFSMANSEKYDKLCHEAKTNPAIGMTHLQVKASTACFPSKINTTTTAAGTLTQEYHTRGKRYVYYENGIVTAIQE